jgi:hypothetical protein
MRAGRKSLWRAAAVTATVLFLSLGVFAAGLPHYLITNNDRSTANSATFYIISAGGKLTQTAVVPTGGFGWDGLGSVATNKINVTHDNNGNCAYLSDWVSVGGSGHPDVTAISIKTLTVAGNFQGSAGDQVSTNGMGLASNGSYVYAEFSQSQTIGTFKRLAGCKLQFMGDISAPGLNGGIVQGIKARQNILVVTFTDGSIESFDISNGIPVPDGDLQYLTGYLQNGYSAAAVDISSDGHFALFGDFPNVVEVSDLSSGKLAPTVVYSGLGSGSGLGGIWLSPDETILYISNFSSGQVEAAFFDKTTGILSAGCTSAPLKGYGSLWSFMASLATANRTGTGGALYVAEPDTRIGIVRLTSSGGTCSFSESPNSPVADTSTETLESIGVFPPRPF